MSVVEVKINMYLLDFLGKILSFIVISISAFFNVDFYQESQVEVDNANKDRDTSITNYVEKHDTKYIYNNKMPSNESKVITEGIDRITYTIIGNDEVKVLQEGVTEVIEKGTGAYGIFTGRLTGYSAECEGCSKEGYVACLTQEKQKFSIVKDGLYYDDSEYGKVRVVAAATQKFPCGTIIEITKQNHDPYYTIVMDRGSAMNKAWSQGGVVIDLSFSSNKEAISSDLTGKNITFKVKRWGW